MTGVLILFLFSRSLSVMATDGRYLTAAELNGPPVYLPTDRLSPELANTVDGFFQGDIVLPDNDSALPKTAGAAAINGSKRWPHARIPYVISSLYNDKERKVIGSAMRQFHIHTCIRFVPRNDNGHYIKINKTGGGCYSTVGRDTSIANGQVVSLDSGCVYTDVVQHELMHAVGFWHEQSRYDRDDYVIINRDNIRPENQHNYNIFRDDQLLLFGTPYDYASIMHYRSDAFAIDTNKPAIRARDGKSKLRGNVFSSTDILKMNRMYNCRPADCWDDDDGHPRGLCVPLVATGQCRWKRNEMMDKCKKSCGFCHPMKINNSRRPSKYNK